MATVITVVGVTNLIYQVLERDYGVPNPITGGGGSLGTISGGSGGLSQAQVQALIDTAIAALPAGGAGGVTLAQVEAAVAEAVSKLDSLLSPAKLRSTSKVPFSDVPFTVDSTENLPLNLDLQAPGGAVKANGEPVALVKDIAPTVINMEKIAWTFDAPRAKNLRLTGDVFDDASGERLLRLSAEGGDKFVKITNKGELACPQVGVESADNSIAHVDLALRPKGQGAVVIGTPGFEARLRADGQLANVDLVLEAKGDGKVKVGKHPVVTDASLEQKLTELGPVIQAAVQSGASRLGDRLTMNSGVEADGKVTIETNNTTGAQHKVDLDVVTQRGGVLSVNGKRVLTVDDALEASGGSIDQAAVEAAVAAATAPLLARIESLETALEGKADKPWVQMLQESLEATADDLVMLTTNKVQAVLDAMNGPGATPDSVKEMFWLLNDVIIALAEATGIELPEGGK